MNLQRSASGHTTVLPTMNQISQNLPHSFPVASKRKDVMSSPISTNGLPYMNCINHN